MARIKGPRKIHRYTAGFKLKAVKPLQPRARAPRWPRSRPSSQEATLRSRTPTATPPCRPTSRPCRAGKATSGAASTRSSCAPSPACARPSNGTRPSTELRARAGFLTFTPSRTTSRWLSSAARRCALSPRRVQGQGSALPRHPRARPARGDAVGDMDPAGRRPARLDPVAPAGIIASRHSLSSCLSLPLTPHRKDGQRSGHNMASPRAGAAE
jgi:hypothetical protein